MSSPWASIRTRPVNLPLRLEVTFSMALNFSARSWTRTFEKTSSVPTLYLHVEIPEAGSPFCGAP